MINKVLCIASHLKMIYYHKYHKFNFVSALTLLVYSMKSNTIPVYVGVGNYLTCKLRSLKH